MVNRKIYTHLDFDGLISAFLMQQLRDDITDVVFTTPQQVKLGRQPITKHDIVLDLPEPSTNYFLWYDHHPHNRCKQNKISGCYDPLAPSCARVMFEKHKALLKKWEGLVITADKIDTANFTQEELLNPDSAGMISKALLTKNIVRDNKLKKELLTLLKTKSLEEISKHPSIILENQRKDQSIKDHLKSIKYEIITKYNQKILVVWEMPLTAPKSIMYHLYAKHPETIVGVRIQNAVNNYKVVGVGQNIFNKDNKAKIGAIMALYGGGGHDKAGSCKTLKPKQVVKEIIEQISVINKTHEGQQ